MLYLVLFTRPTVESIQFFLIKVTLRTSWFAKRVELKCSHQKQKREINM